MLAASAHSAAPPSGTHLLAFSELMGHVTVGDHSPVSSELAVIRCQNGTQLSEQERRGLELGISCVLGVRGLC